MTDEVRIDRDELTYSRRLFVNGVHIGDVTDAQIVEASRPTLEAFARAHFFDGVSPFHAYAERLVQAFEQMMTATRRMVSVSYDAEGAFRRLEWALMTKAQRRRAGKRYVREEIWKRRAAQWRL